MRVKFPQLSEELPRLPEMILNCTFLDCLYNSRFFRLSFVLRQSSYTNTGNAGTTLCDEDLVVYLSRDIK